MSPVEVDLGEISVEPWQVATVTSREGTFSGPFLPSWYLVPDDVAPHFVVSDVRVGPSTQSCSGGVPADLFAESCRFRHLQLSLAHDVVGSRSTLSVTVTNCTKKRRTFRCRVVGNYAPSGPSSAGGHYVVSGLSAFWGGEGHLVATPATRFDLDVSPMRLFVPDDLVGAVSVESLFAVQDGVLSSVPRESLSDQSLRGSAEVSLRPRRTVRAGSDIFARVVKTGACGPYFRSAVVGELGT